MSKEKYSRTQYYKDKLEEEGIKLKIARSKRLNAERLKLMARRSELVLEAIKESEQQIAAFMRENEDTYKELLKKLIVQSLIKLMEADVKVQCRESDKDLVESVFEEAQELYQTIMSEQVQMLKGRKPPIKLSIDESKWLPEYNPDDKENSCVGGVRLHARNNRIVCSNTIDERLDLCKQEAIPRIRELLFPDYS